MTDAFESTQTTQRFMNLYRCTNCATEWEDAWDATCDDECPRCGTVMTPYLSDDELP